MDVRQEALSKMSKEELLDGLSKGELTIVEYLKYAEGQSSQTTRSLRRSRDWLMILYPEDPKHVRILEWLKAHEHIYKYAYILHDKDVWMEEDEEVQNGEHVAGELKKAHWHVYFHSPSQSTPSSMTKFMGVHVEKCNNVESTLLYLLHDTAESAHKHHYDVADLIGTKKVIDKVSIQKSHFV